jgi:SIR2-like protein
MTESIVAGAATAQAHVGGQSAFRDLVVRELYGGQRSRDFKPGAIAQQVAWWKRQFADQIRLATFNYDDLLERALRPHMRARGVVQDVAEPAGEARVYHLHGRLNDDHKDLRFVLSDDDYAKISLAKRWQDKVMMRALRDSLCVFVGLSFTDPNLTRWLHRAGGVGGRRHLALFSRQSSPQLPADVRRELEHSTAERWSNVMVDVVFTDFYGEIAQLLHEAALVRSRSGLPDFNSRAAATHAAANHLLAPPGSRRFRDAQWRAAAWMADLVRGIEDIAHANNLRLRDERLGAGLWIVDHSAGEIVHAAASDRAHTERGTMLPIRLDFASQWSAVEAVTRGPVQSDPDVYASRWHHVRALPLIVDDDRPGRLVAGVVTLTSTRPFKQSVFSRLRLEARRQIDEFATSHCLEVFE